MSKAQIYEELFRKYEKIRDANKAIASERRASIYSRFPRIEEIDREINMLGFSLSKAIVRAESQEEREDYISSIRTRNAELDREKKHILVTAGYKEDYLEPIYNCPLCKDMGIIGDKKCECLSKAYSEAIYEKSNIKSVLERESFESFDLTYYSQEFDKGEGISPYDNMHNNLLICKGFCADFNKVFKNLIFYGNPGLGKTFLCSAIAGELLAKGVNVVYISAYNLFKSIEDEKFGRKDSFEGSEFYEYITQAELLIIDDLGTEFSNIISTSALFSIVNSRFIGLKPTVISTNLSPVEMAAQYSERIVSRIYGEYTVLRFFGEDIRIVKRLRQ